MLPISGKRKKFSLSLYSNGNEMKIYQFKAKDSEINVNLLCLGNASKDFKIDNMKKIGLYGFMHDFSVHYDNIDISETKDIQKYFMTKQNIIQMFRCIEQVFIVLVLCLSKSLAIKCVFLNNQSLITRPMLIDSNPDELHYYPFLTSLDRCDRTCNIVRDPFGRICIPNKTEAVNLNVFNIINEGVNIRSK